MEFREEKYYEYLPYNVNIYFMEVNMNKLLQSTLVSAILATSGFATTQQKPGLTPRVCLIGFRSDNANILRGNSILSLLEPRYKLNPMQSNRPNS